MKINRALVATFSGAMALTAVAGCGSSSDDSGDGSTTKIELWTPQAGSPEIEVQNMQAMLDAFTKANPEYSFEYKTYPFESYATSVQGAAAANELPCMLAVDAPNAPNWAWAGRLQPLELPSSVTDSLIPGAKGVYDDKVYSVGYWDAGLAMFARKSVLDKHQVRIPTVDQPWTKDEFDQALATLSKDGDFKYPLSLGNPDIYSGTPFLWSFGGDLINRDDYQSAEGVLNGPESVAYGDWLQDLVAKKYISTAPTDGNPFLNGDVPLLWTGNWDSTGSVEKYADDVVFLPPPDLGNGPIVGAGSFGYGTSTGCSDKQREGVNKFLEFSLTTDNLVKISDTQLVIPATAEAAAKSENYGPDGDFTTFAQLESEHSMIRPPTPAFPVIADIFNKASADILAGADVQDTLDQAAKEIDADIVANDGYGLG
jgi:multiple sugar transport system substrate-binding protein